MKAVLIYSGIPGINGADYMVEYCINACILLGYEVVKVGSFGGKGVPAEPPPEAKGADFALCLLGYGVKDGLFENLRSMGIPTCLWTTNDEMNLHFKNSKRLAPHVDLYATYTRKRMEWFEENKIKTILLPIAADHTLYFPMPETEQIWDVAMIGCPHNGRIRIIKSLHKLLPELKWHIDLSMGLSYAQINALYNCTKIVIAPFMDCDQGSFGIAYGCPCRTFEVPASGAFHLQVFREGLRDVFGEGEITCIKGTDINEWADAIRYFLKEECLRNEIAETAYRKVMKEHLYIHRIETIRRELHG